MRQTQCIGRVKDGIKPIGDKLACGHCGDTEDVVVRLEYVAGCKEPIPQCRDSTACWARWDRKHGLERSEDEATPAQGG